MNPMIPADHYQFPGPVELVEQMDQGHYPSTAAESAGVGVVGEVPAVAAVD
jgi:hypothetical protein